MCSLKRACHLIQEQLKLLQSVAPPTTVSEVRSLLSSATFCSRFIKDFAIITRPLRQLICDGVSWQWTQEEQSSFERLKETLSVKTTLGYFDPTSIFVDGSPVGLGAVLTQEDELTKEVTPLHYASCPLTPTQARYPQIDQFTRQSNAFTCLLMANPFWPYSTTRHPSPPPRLNAGSWSCSNISSL